MKKLITALAFAIALSGCASDTYLKQATVSEIQSYCPFYDFMSSSRGAMIKCDSVIEDNLTKIKLDRKERRKANIEKEKAEKDRLQKEIDSIKKVAVSAGTTYKGRFQPAFADAHFGYGLPDGFYELNFPIQVGGCANSVCYGYLEGNREIFVLRNFDNLLTGTYIYGGYVRARIDSMGRIELIHISQKLYQQ